MAEVVVENSGLGKETQNSYLPQQHFKGEKTFCHVSAGD